MKATNRVAMNTGILYAKMFVTIGTSLFTTRIVLDQLGVSDFGLFNLIAGVIAMLAFLNNAMAVSSQRFLSFTLGTGKIDKLRSIFTTNIVLHLAIGVIILIVLGIASLFLFNGFLNIPPNRIGAAKAIFHFSTVSIFLTVISVPYNGLINAFEDLYVYAAIDILGCVLKLLSAFYLMVAEQDKLITYGFLIMCTQLISLILYRLWCRYRYSVAKGRFKISDIDLTAVKEMTSFAGWSLFGILANLGKNQGIALIMNLFYGTVVNAAYAVANQINSQLSFFSQTLMNSIRPQITKSEGAGNRERTMRLTIVASKFSFLLLSFIAIPLFIEMPSILRIWIKNVPENAVIFCRLIVTMTLILQLSMGIIATILSVGKIRNYQIVVSILQLTTLPIGYFLLKAGYPSYTILVVAIIFEVISCIYRIYYFKKITGHPIVKYIKEVYTIPIIGSGLVFTLVWFVRDFINNEPLRIFFVISCSLSLQGLINYFVVLNSYERHKLKDLFFTVKSKFKLSRV